MGAASRYIHAYRRLFFLIILGGAPLFLKAQHSYDIIFHLKPEVNGWILFSGKNKSNQTDIYSNSLPEQLSQSMNIWRQVFVSDLSKEIFLQKLRAQPEVISAQFNDKVFLRAEVLPNDIYFNQQWNLRNVGQIGGKVGADCKASFAWSLPWKKTNAKGDPLVVAVIDDVVDTAISEINWFRNINDTPNNGIDDDGNGYIDDYYGWNTISNNGDVQAPSAGYYHGSHVCGIIGAKGNNDTGTVGIHWGVKVLPIVGANVSDVSDIIQAYNYVIDQKKLYLQTNGSKGAYIVATNSSFGIDNQFQADQPIWCAMYDSMGKYGILSAAATTNALSDVDVMGDIPSTCTSEFLIMTTSSNFADQHTTRGYGKNSVDISAPGEGIFSTNPSFTFSAKSGTSFASPHIAGAVSFLFSTTSDSFTARYQRNMPTQILQIKKALMEGVDTIAGLSIRNKTSGRLNIYKAALKLNTPLDTVTSALTAIDFFEVNVRNFEENLLIEWLGEIKQISLFDLTGNLILSKSVQGEESLIVEKENFSTGLYLLIFESEKGYRVIKKIKK